MLPSLKYPLFHYLNRANKNPFGFERICFGVSVFQQRISPRVLSVVYMVYTVLTTDNIVRPQPGDAPVGARGQCCRVKGIISVGGRFCEYLWAFLPL